MSIREAPEPAAAGDLEKRLREAQAEAGYYRRIAMETGRRRLREINQMAQLITERRQVEAALRESELKFRSLFDHSPQAVALVERVSGAFVEVNDKFCELVGHTRQDLLQFNLTRAPFYPGDDLQKFLDLLERHGEVHGLEMELAAPGDDLRHVLLYGRLVRIGQRMHTLVIHHDVTNQRQLEAQLHHAQKMEAIGTLAGGIAHDFNNLLMSIQGNVSLVLYDLDTDHPHFPVFKTIEKQVLSGAQLTAQMLGYARRGRYEVKAVDLNQLVRETSETFARTRKEIVVRHRLAEELNAVAADLGQIEQVLWNLYVNASDAMPTGGELMMSTANTDHHAMQGKVYNPKPGPYVLLQVADTGNGMDQAVKERIFEPFFTTKELGRGTGLGLASVYGIVKGHGGYIDVASQTGQGTIFSIFLPSTTAKPRQEEAEAYPRSGAGNGIILIVDDEERILEVAAALVAKLGYRVLKARSGPEALELYQSSQGAIDLVILDMIMPGMGGGKIYDRLKAIDCGQKVLLSSGYSIDGQARDILDRGCDGFIQKPFNLAELSAKIKQVLTDP